jgi:hypothetical protein
MKNIILWDVTPRSPVEIHRRFGGQLYSELTSKPNHKPARSMWQAKPACFLPGLLLDPNDGNSMFLQKNRDSSTNIMAKLLAGQPRNLGSILGRGRRFFSSPHRPDRLWSPHTLLSNGSQRPFPQE